jgi:hypothetical protein
MSETGSMVQTIQSTATVHVFYKGRVAFDGHSSWYRAPPHLEPLLRTARETRREVKFTTDRDCNIHAVELLPSPPSALDRFAKVGAWLRMRRMRR